MTNFTFKPQTQRFENGDESLTLVEFQARAREAAAAHLANVKPSSRTAYRDEQRQRGQSNGYAWSRSAGIGRRAA